MNRAALAGWQVLGDSDAKATMQRMAKAVRAALGNESLTQTARGIVAQLAPRNVISQARTLRAWADQHFRFVNDPLGVELIESPIYHLDEIKRRGFVQGDCDDAATLCAALGLSIGIAATFVAYAFNTPTAPYSHVVCSLWPLGIPNPPRIECDITRPKGMQPPKVTRHLMVRV